MAGTVQGAGITMLVLLGDINLLTLTWEGEGEILSLFYFKQKKDLYIHIKYISNLNYKMEKFSL